MVFLVQGGKGIEVKVGGGVDLPQDAAALFAYDAVIVSDVARSALDDRSMRALESYVRDHGGGLLYAAGDSLGVARSSFSSAGAVRSRCTSHSSIIGVDRPIPARDGRPIPLLTVRGAWRGKPGLP